MSEAKRVQREIETEEGESKKRGREAKTEKRDGVSEQGE